MRALSASLLLLALLTGALPAQAALVPAAYRAAILLRSLGYERGILAGKGDVVVVVLQGADKGSQADAREMMTILSALAARMSLGDRKVQVRSHQHATVNDTLKALNALAPSALYFAAGLEELAGQLGAAVDRAHWVPMCADGVRLGAGCVLAVRTHESSSQLVVDLARAKRAGLSFDARLLRLAQVLQ
ncbi:MAG TPA: YfiR/HmsC family protein [Polyangiales bacterium]